MFFKFFIIIFDQKTWILAIGSCIQQIVHELLIKQVMPSMSPALC